MPGGKGLAEPLTPPFRPLARCSLETMAGGYQRTRFALQDMTIVTPASIARAYKRWLSSPLKLVCNNY